MIFSFAFVQNMQAQEWSLPDNIGYFISKPTEEALLEKINILESVDTRNLSAKERWCYNLTKSSILLYSDQDSSLHYFLKAQNYNPRATCKVMRSDYMLEQNRLYLFKNGGTCFLTDLPNFDHVAYLENCNINYPENNYERTIPESELEALIMSNDQSERLRDTMDWDIQNRLDSINRNILDSLYEKHMSFKPFNKYEQDAFSLVLHHSNNCDWIYKWFVIWLDETKKGNVVGGKVLGHAFTRMLTLNKGYCYELNPKRCEEFRTMLSMEYNEYEKLWKE